jgi:hypothetical protein
MDSATALRSAQNDGAEMAMAMAKNTNNKFGTFDRSTVYL